MHNNNKRIIFDIVLFFSLFFLSWWVSLALIIAGIFIFESYYECLVASLILDCLYSLFGVSFLSTFPMTVGVGAIFLLSFLVKEHFTFNPKL
jgi:hypothetical protein